MGAPKGIWKANLENWKGFMHGLFGFSFFHYILFFYGIQRWGKNILPLLLIIIMNWVM